MITYNQQLDNEILSLLEKYPKNCYSVINSKGLKPTSINRQYLRDYIEYCVKDLVSKSNFKYALKTKLYWILNKIQNWDDERVKCKICGNPLFGVDVKHIESGYERNTCGGECRAKFAQKQILKTMQNRYGVDNAFQIPTVLQKLKLKSDLIQEHRNMTRKKNNSFNKSKKRRFSI